MRLPVPRSRLVRLTLIGALLTAAVTATLLVPGLLTDNSRTHTDSQTLGADAPTPNDQFTPASQAASRQGDDDDHEAHEEYEEGEEYESLAPAPGELP